MPERINPSIASEKHNAGRTPDIGYVAEIHGHTPGKP
jgi:hypothetical protein